MARRGTTGAGARPDPAPVLDGPDHLLGLRGTASAVAVSLLGAVLVAAAPLLGAVRAADGPVGGPQPGAAVVVALLALLVPVAAGVLLREGRVAGAVGVLLGGGAAALAGVVADLQLVVRAIDADRLELARPLTASALSPGAGTWAVLVGHGLGVAAAVVGGVALRRSGVLEDPDAGTPGGDGRAAGDGTAAGRTGPRVALPAAVAAGVLAAAQLAPGLRSTDLVLLAPSPLGAPAAVAGAAVLLAVLVLVVTALAAVSASLATAAGAVAGVGLGALAAVAPRVVAGLLAPGVSVGWGSWLGLVAGLVLVGSAVAAPVAARRRAAEPAPAPTAVAGPVLPGVRRATRLAGVAGVLAGLLGGVGALLPAFTVPAGIAVPEVAATRLVLIAAVVLLAVAAGVLVGGDGPGADLRPALGPLAAGLLLAAGGLGQAVLTGLAAPGVGVGTGPVLVGLATVAGVVAAVLAGTAGAAERDDVDTSGGDEAGRAPVLLAALVAVGALLLALAPTWTSAGARGAALLGSSPSGGGPGLDAWAQLLAAGAVATAAGVATASRRRRARVLLAGAVVVVLLALATWPLRPAGTAGTSPRLGALGAVLALLGLVGLLVVAGREAPPPEPVRPTPARQRRARR